MSCQQRRLRNVRVRSLDVTPLEDRAVGVLVGSACGDALGAGYEFGPPLAPDAPVSMRGGNGFRPGEWTDDTSMAVAVAQAAARYRLTSTEGLDAVAAGFLRWLHDGPIDIGIQTGAVLRGARGTGAAALTAMSEAYFREHPERGCGNGALMRTAPVALSTLDDEKSAWRAATAVGRLTHADPVSGEACALWTFAIRHAVLHASFDGLRIGLAHLKAPRQEYWTLRLDEAEQSTPDQFDRNGWVVQALQAAWSAIATTPIPGEKPARHLQKALENAVRGGRDADTVAAIAGGLLGARWGVAAIPREWTEAIFGWPGYRGDDLERLALSLVT
jgi:ADP-ribosyl-[dinitrogen reductase] hydrolase